MSLDHGMLNVPLSKRGNIDRQIDRYKTDLAADAKASAKVRAAETRRLRVIAKQAVTDMAADAVERIAKAAEISPAKARKSLMSDAYFRPEWVLKMLKIEVAK